MVDKVHFNFETHEYTLKGIKIPGVTRVLQETGLINFDFVRPDVLAASSKFGVAVHYACELQDRRILSRRDLSTPLIPYLDAWMKFKQDFGVSFDPDDIEKIVYSKRWNFCGTLDRVALIKKRLTLIEIKSSTVMQPATGLQTAAYQIAYEEMTSKRIRQRWGVQLLGNGNYKITPYTDESDRNLFLAALNLYNWKKINLKKG